MDIVEKLPKDLQQIVYHFACRHPCADMIRDARYEEETNRLTRLCKREVIVWKMPVRMTLDKRWGHARLEIQRHRITLYYFEEAFWNEKYFLRGHVWHGEQDYYEEAPFDYDMLVWRAEHESLVDDSDDEASSDFIY